jgi:membrane associated rhomboid family serine protease
MSDPPPAAAPPPREPGAEEPRPLRGPPPPPDRLPPGFVRWRSDLTPPPEFWAAPVVDGADAPEEFEEREEAPPLDLWRTVGGTRPWGTAVLLLAWSAVFATLALRGELGEAAAYRAWGANLSNARGWTDAWRLLAYTFLHAGAAHLFFNGLAMAILGPAVERVFSRAHFWVIVAAGGAASALVSQAWYRATMPGVTSSSIGASGAIFALGGAMLAAAWRLRRQLPPSRARALAGALLPMLLQGLVAGFQKTGTDNAAHVGGLVAGMVLGLVLGLDPRLAGRPLPRASRALGAAAALALLLALAIGVWSGLRASGASG